MTVRKVPKKLDYSPCGCSDYEFCTDKPNCRRPVGVIPGYSSHVRERFDSERPKYTEAVKSIAAFCDKNSMTKLCFQALVSHLDDACAEAVVRGRMLRHPGRLGSVIKLK